jgi:putative transposase
MANTYSQIHIQIIFAVKGREQLIKEEHREELQKYITGIITNKNQKLLAIYCMPDHTHIFMGIRPNIAISDLVRDIKANSSSYITENNLTKSTFSWQEGYGRFDASMFSYSKSQVDAVVKYVLNQAEHHKKRTFREEYIDFLQKFEIQYDEKFLFDWIE